MYELALFILDLAQNALSAGSSLIKIWVTDDTQRNRRCVMVADNGCGMRAEALARALDPFMTSKRRRRRVGLGLPFFKHLVESCDGSFRINSRPGRGTVVHGWLARDHVDQPPLGDLADMLLMLVVGNPAVDFRMSCAHDGERVVVDTRPVRAALGADARRLWQTPDLRAWFAGELGPVNGLLRDDAAPLTSQPRHHDP
jgi:hypothetical protein